MADLVVSKVARPVALGLALGLLASGCSLAPKYTRPESPVGDRFGAEGAAGGSAAELGWRDVFQDDRLRALIALALENNRDLRIASLSTERLRALYRIQRAPLLPSVSATGSATYQDPPAYQPSPPQAYSATINVTAWELDFFGRIRSLADAALEHYLATEEAQRSAHLSIVAQVTIADLTERALAEQLALAKQTSALVGESLAITRRSFDVGVATELDLRTAESQAAVTRATIALYEQRHAQAVHALSFLVGANLPPSLPRGEPLESVRIRTELPPGLPSDLLQRRPDVLAAEHELMAANATIGAARAAFFPSISLTGSAGFGSAELGQLFSGDSATWMFSPRVSVPIFQGGALEANLDATEIAKSIEVARYQKAIQSAFREVSDALVGQKTLVEQLDAQKARVEADERRYALANDRYRTGIESYLTLLTAQRDLVASQQSLIDARLARFTNVANLYRALGGGWRADSGDGSARARQ